MKRPVRILSMMATAALSAWMAAPAATAGNEIVKCIATSGQVTLTDQPCESGTTTVKMSSVTSEAPPPGDDSTTTTIPAPAARAQRHVLPAAQLHQEAWTRPQVAHTAPLSRDVATLKAARRMLMLQETRPRLAGLN